jgi:hypothetical protein
MCGTNERRANRMAEVLAIYGDNDPCTNLVDLLADAMHWCNSLSHDFPEALALASMHFQAELVEPADFGGLS